MTERLETPPRSRLLWRRDPLKPARHLTHAPRAAPVARFVTRSPMLLIGAAVIGVVGFLAWRNRERIAERAAPLLQDARVRGRAIADSARIRAQELGAKAQALTAKARAAAARRSAPAEANAEIPPTDVH